MNITDLVQSQRSYYQTGITRSYDFRFQALVTLKQAIRSYEQELHEALYADFRKSAFETYMTETGILLEELGYHQKHLRGWMKDQRVTTPLAQFPAISYRKSEPYGIVLIMAPWNYPLQLCLNPLIGAISAGNCAIVKPSAYAPETSRVLAKMIRASFDPAYIAVVEGGREENQQLLKERFDYIFFTGSVAVGKIVMESASRYLTPVTLELGGKSPVIVDESADLTIAARRILFGKILNAGQTCVAPDYVLIQRKVLPLFLEACKQAMKQFFPDGDTSEMPCIISMKHFERLSALLTSGTIALGGHTERATRFIELTVLTDVSPESAIMQEEIFGPLLPLLPYDTLQEAISFITQREKPLALYLFTTDKHTKQQVFNSCSFGGGCVNDTIIHLANSAMGFGGVGQSGMGEYHGAKSYETFSHYRSIVEKANWLDLPMRYHPYTKQKLAIIKKFMK